MTAASESARPSYNSTILVMAALGLTLHLLVNIFGGYGYFRDELYYIACSKRLAAGYVDQPPLSVFVMAGVRLILGESVFAIRLVPALLSGVSVALLGLLVRRLGGARTAVVLASLAFIVAPHLTAYHSYFSMNSLDVMFWMLTVHALLGAAESGSMRSWLLLGLALGLGLLNKASVLWLCAGVGVAILVLGQLRRQLRTSGPYAAAALAIALFSPFVIWNALHGWPHLEFMHNATTEKYASLTRMRFLSDQFVAMNPITFLISIPGLVWFLRPHEGSRRRLIGIMFLVVFAILVVNPHTKSEYMAAAYPMLFACGGVAIEQMRSRWRTAAVLTLAGLLVVSGVLVAPFAMPLLPVETFVEYSRALGRTPNSVEGKELADLPQFFADMHGWEQLAQNVSKVYLTNHESERSTTVAFVTNYGDAGALELFARYYPLPRVICNHNSYWFWGTGPVPVTTFIRLGGSREDYLESYSDVSLAGVHTCAHCMPYENHRNIFIARNRQVPIDTAWAEYKHFE